MPERKLKITKADIALAVLFLAAAAAVLAWSVSYFTGGADSVVITAHGEIVGEYSLSEDREISVGDGSNVIAVKDGTVFMKSAAC